MNIRYLFLFHTPLGAVLLKKALAQRQIMFRVFDAPRQLTAECGVAVSFNLPHDDCFQPFLNQDVSAVYRLDNESFPVLMWRDEQ
ncbi:putative Se/S carrier-like protein [Mixta intestinalis]|jgi:hypothetical protein|uniref:Putative Se/S carrier protein-like domain-containing protein n=1 Tax=Mixta intestinalis TaxID=1615494 RepID=A0A6P1Q6N2_9GAMM|nr:putative Se/S carrier-like protein [Mixta intestinalis]QHM73697.1 hypothetical protein C7M51_04053 [Mixta intestinalis]